MYESLMFETLDHTNLVDSDQECSFRKDSNPILGALYNMYTILFVFS